MLQTLTITNYALIQSLKIDFNSGFSVITGETGAGKSIILGAMHLMLGQRADISVMNDKTKKCIVEGCFEITEYKLKSVFEALDLDYWDETIIRREITPSGKSRAFINDTPVNLATLKSITNQLIDIHSQQRNSEIDNKIFQLEVVDSTAKCLPLRTDFHEKFLELKQLEKEIGTLKEKARLAAAEQEFHQFQFDQLDKAKLQADEEETMEAEQKLLTHSEEIKSALSFIQSAIDEDENGLLNSLTESIRTANNISEFYAQGLEIAQRLNSVKIELADIASEAQGLSEEIEYDPGKLEYINERLSLIFELKSRHHVDNVHELIGTKNALENQLVESGNLEVEIEKKEHAFKTLMQQLEKKASDLSSKRKISFIKIEKFIVDRLQKLGMIHSQFKIQMTKLSILNTSGFDDVRFLFSANKNMPLQEMSGVASGGEKSRLMLVIKSLLAENKSLPTIIFDEIDTGVSGDIAQKIANQIAQLSKNIQVLVITHLPQVASKGIHHYKVYKQDTSKTTITSIKPLLKDERILEIAELLSGKNPSDAAIQNAIELMQN